MNYLTTVVIDGEALPREQAAVVLRKAYEAGTSIAGLAKRYGLAQGTAQRLLAESGTEKRPAGKAMTEIRRMAIADLSRCGWTADAIADALNLEPEAVERWSREDAA